MIRITRAGWIYVVLTVAVGFAAVNTANNLIYVITSVLLGFMLISGIAGKFNLEAVQVQLALPDEIYAESPAPMVVRVRNRRRFLPVFLISVHVGPNAAFFTYLDRKSEATQTIPIHFARRGLSPPMPVWVASLFPFGFFVRTRLVDPLPSVLVFPKLTPSPYPAAPLDRTSKGEDRSLERHTGEDHDLRSIREYQAGDPLKKIHWKSSARTGRWLTKEFSMPARDTVVVDLDQMRGQDVEKALSCAAFVINAAARRGAAVGLLVGNRRYEPQASLAHKRKLLTVLALYGED
uniref:DUF58 domain-containing protein n=1 Tax=Desulfacinum infernum TaxID=35837 RepID=A0A832A258_9BACT